MSQYSKITRTFSSEDNALKKIIDMVPESSHVLDVGCASGYLGKQLIQMKGCRIVGVDLNQDDANVAKSCGYSDVYVHDLDIDNWEENFGDQRFDAIVFADVLEHLKYPDIALKKATSLLAKNGQILVSIPNISHASVRLELLQGNFEPEELGILDRTHLKFWTKKTFLQLLNDVGLYAEKIENVFVDLPLTIMSEFTRDIEFKSDRFLHSVEARTYQYVFRLVPSDMKNVIDSVSTKPMTIKHDFDVRLNDALTEILILEQRLKDAEKHVKNLEKVLEDKELCLNAMSNNTEQLKTIIANTEADGVRLRKRIDDFVTHANELGKELEQYRMHTKNLENEIENKRVHVSSLQAELTTVKNIVNNRFVRLLLKFRILH